MSLLDNLAGALGGGNNNLVSSALDLLQNHPGGLTGMIQAFQQGGLGDVISSWVGAGQNLPISADQIQSVLGSGVLQQFAEKAGISTQDAGSQLANLLPNVVDKLTPGGAVPSGDLKSMGMSLLQNLLSR
jgi:uncharacterized protein YidB (DUF937 family)